MSTATRPYRLLDNETKQVVIVENAINPAHVIRTFVRDRFTVTPLSASEAIALMRDGVETISAAKADLEAKAS